MAEHIHAALSAGRSRRAIQFKGEWISWGELADIVNDLNRIFEALGLGEGAAIACALRNRPEHAATMMGVVGGGRCLVTLNALTPDEKLAADVIAASAPALVAWADDWARPALREAAARSGAAGISLTGDPARPVAFVEGLEWIGPGPHQAPLPEIAILMLTSGTTGAPKRAPLKRTVLERQLIEAQGGPSPLPSADHPPASGVGIMHASIVHIGGVWGVLGSAMAGRPMCLMEKFNVAEWRAAVAEHRPAASGAPPAALRMILDADIPREELSSLKTLGAGTAPLDPDIVDEFMRRYDLPVLSNYGATEFAGGVASWSLKAFREHWADKRGAVGRIHRSAEARVVDSETGEALPCGAEGVLELKGYAVGGDQAWVRTTDRAVLDADRFLWIRGRVDEAIIRGGFKVHPGEVAAVLELHSAVREASVVGLPDRRLGQVPVAAVELREGAPTPSEAELADFVRARLTAYCVPTRILVVGELPRTPSMKVSLPAVRELFAG
jgi:acyl-CoA synthetase (AMP-forming)/AMP-acid ligase II